jgi:hypothetical protein
MYKSSTNNWATFFNGKGYVLIITTMDWATVRATFSQTHLVTLVGDRFWKIRHFAAKNELIGYRVTRLGEFSIIGLSFHERSERAKRA